MRLIIPEHELVSNAGGHFQFELQDISHLSDGYHTFGELYDHRHALFMVICRLAYPKQAKGWKAWKNDQGETCEGWFLAGLILPEIGQVSYHLPEHLWNAFELPQYDYAPPWDGHTSTDVMNRLMDWASAIKPETPEPVIATHPE